MATIDKRLRSVNPSGLPEFRFSQVLWAGAVTGAIALPWLASGYLFGTDWPGPRFIRWPTQLTGSSPLEALLAAISAVLSAELAAKVLVVGSLFVAALGAFVALPYGDFVPRASASLIYAVNPFVYGRLHYGQLYLVAAYAVLPWVALRVFRLLAAPSLLNGLLVAVGLVVMAMFAVHLLLVGFLLLGVASISAIAFWRLNRVSVVRLGVGLAVAGAATLVLSAYWLIPYLAGKTYESQVISRVGSGDLAAYGAVGDPSVGLVPNLLGLYGFWAEAVHRFPSLKLFVSGWELVLAALLVLAAIGAVFVFLVQDETFRRLRYWVIALIITGLVALVLDAGVAEPHIAPFIRWLDVVFPPYRGMRDSGKWASMLALVYAQLIPLGLIGVHHGLSGLVKNRTLRASTFAVLAGLALALPLYYGNGLLFGMHGQIKPSQYPAGWYTADRVTASDNRHGRALFLPWHLYLHLSFVRNVNSVIANPAPGFFSIPIVVSGNPEVPGIAPPETEDQRAIQGLVNAGAAGDWGDVLASRNIAYVLLAKEVDWENFRYLDQQAGLLRVADYGSLVLYRVMAKN
jgi:hypothetical protein